jgi:hypothetical protein
MRIYALVLLAAFLCSPTFSRPAVAGARLSKSAACSLLKRKVAKLDSLPETGPPGAGWYCDISNLSGSRWFVVALRSNKNCAGTCSNLMGWYAVDRRTGVIHAYDIAKLRVGFPL